MDFGSEFLSGGDIVHNRLKRRSASTGAGAQASPCPRRVGSHLLAIHAALLIVLLVPAQASAQEYGQWTWDALFGFGGRNRDNLREGEVGRSFDERSIGLALGMNGFIVHPAVSRFRIGLDLEFIDTNAGQELDTNRTGLSGNFDLFPRGDYRASLYVHRQLYDYSGAAADDPFTLLAAPDTLTTYGARFRAMQGFLKGSLVGVERSAIDFVGSAARQQESEREFWDWSRDSGNFNHHVRLEHRFRDIGTVDVNYEDFRVNLDERGDFSPTWHWTLSGSGLRQESESFGLPAQRVDDYQLRTRLTHDVRELDQIDMIYEFGRNDVDTRDTTQSHGVAASYRWRPNLMWQFGPIVSYAQISSEVLETRAPRAGVIVGWDRAAAGWDSSIIARGSYGTLEREAGGMTQDESQFAGSFIGNVGHGSMEGLRKEIEVEVLRNRLQIAQAGPIVPPGLGLPLPGLGTEDLWRARLTLGHRWDSQFLNAWGDWTRRQTDPLATNELLTIDTLTATVQYGAHRFDLKMNVADSDVEEMSRGHQSLRSAGLLASWRPWRSVSLRGSYRRDERIVDLAPNIDGAQLEAGVRWQLGQFYLDVSYLEIIQEFSGGPETTLRSVAWRLSRRFGGWLPIVTGPQRRGVIR
jgi:hypothetical protein